MIEKLRAVVGESGVMQNELMSKHTTFRIGGPADVMILPQDAEQVGAVIRILEDASVPYFVLGNGSNLLVGDRGVRGTVIKLGKEFARCEVDDTSILAQSGIKLSRLANVALEHQLTGLEFAAGIPGTLGGAVFMNAGAYGGEMQQVVTEVTYLKHGVVKTIPAEACAFGYRTSLFSKTERCVVLNCRLRLTHGNREEIRAQMEELAERRISKQPLNFPSAGSTFRRPEGHFAGKLIQDAGLMGLRIGGASVSEKHAGFLINDGGATAADVRALIAKVQEEVYARFGVMLEPEVKFVGEF